MHELWRQRPYGLHVMPGLRAAGIRKAAVRISNVADARTGALCASFIDGEPEPILTLHRTTQDPEWTPDRVRRKAWAAFMLYTLVPLVLLLFIAMQQPLIGMGAALAVAGRSMDPRVDHKGGIGAQGIMWAVVRG